MASLDDDLRPIAEDDFERYYAEKIWEWIPPVYRHEDGIAEDPEVLRSLVEVLALQAAIARRSTDRLWEDQFIDFCDDWAVPYIGDLVGTRLVNALSRRGRRVDVAKTLYYRRRKGTLQVLESLIRDMTGWEGVVVESFRRLARLRHGLDPEPGGLVGPVTHTPPGGTANLRAPRGGDLLPGPFDEYHHTPDVRQHRGLKGRYNIPRLNFHLYRLLPFEVRLATAVSRVERRFTFDPSGRDIPLFRPSQRRDSGRCGSVEEWAISAPIPCRLLGAASYRLSEDAVPAGFENELGPLVGVLFGNERRLRETLLTLIDTLTLDTNISSILLRSITDDSPRRHLIPEAIAVLVAENSGEAPFSHEMIVSGDLEDWGQSLTLPDDKRIVIDPERGRFLLLEDAGSGEQKFVPVYHYGFSGPVGAGTYDRRGSVVMGDEVTDIDGGARNTAGHELEAGPITGFSLPNDGIHQFINSKTYIPDAPADNTITDVNKLNLQAKNGERPYIKLKPRDDEHAWIFEALTKPAGDPDAEANIRCLMLEGLWLGIEPTDIAMQTLAAAEDRCDPVATTLVLDGVFDRVVIRHCTLDPGGEQARLEPLECMPIPYVALEVRGQVEELIVENAIVGPILEATSDTDPCSVGKLIIRDSIVQSLDPGVNGITTRIGEVHLERVTVFGDVEVNRLFATEALIQGSVMVTDNQHGCFRFSATNQGADVRLPPQYESHLIEGGIPNHYFVSRRFGDPGYGQLSGTVPQVIVRGAENGSEIGAFSSLLSPVKLDSLKAKVNEFMPFGLIAQYINEN
jgi:hypothetical protein